MSSDEPSIPAIIAPRRRPRGRGLLWLIVLVLLVAAGWKLYPYWQAYRPATSPPAAEDASIGDPNVAIGALRREQHDLAQRMSDTTSSEQVLRDEVLGVGERAALLEQTVARIANTNSQGEQSLRLDEAELLLTIGEQQIELSSDLASALHAYALADGTLAGSSDPAALNLRQSLAQEIASLRALPTDPRAAVAGRLDAFEASLDTPGFAIKPVETAANHSVFDRVVGSVVEVRKAPSQDLIDPASRDAAVTAVRLELAVGRLALARRDADDFHAALARMERWLPRLYPAETVESQRRQLAALRQAPLRYDLPALGGTLAELRRLRQQQPQPAGGASASGPVPLNSPAESPASAAVDRQTP